LNLLLPEILNELEAFICKAFKGEAIVELLRVLNNAARRSRLLRGDESLRLALWVKIDEKKIIIRYTIREK